MAERRIVLFGKTGDGKSSTGNTILGEQKFSSRNSARSESHNIEAREKTIYGKSTTVVDTPGLFCTQSPDFHCLALESITKCSPGPNVFIVVLQLGMYGKQQNEEVEKIWSALGKEAFRFSVVLFTHGDNLDEGQTIEQFVDESEDLKQLLEKCGGRCHVIDNKYWNQEHEYRSNRIQVEKLLNTIDELLNENGGDYYTKDMLQKCEGQILKNLRNAFLGIRNKMWPQMKNKKFQIFFLFRGLFCAVSAYIFLKLFHKIRE